MCSEFDFDRLVIPKQYDAVQTKALPFYCNAHLAAVMQEIKNKGWTLYAVTAKRGRCQFSSKTITIPLWALKRGTDYARWYIAHEIAHAINFIENGREQDNHGPNFMAILKRICPANSIHFELGYKPRNAASAGIFAKDF